MYLHFASNEPEAFFVLNNVACTTYASNFSSSDWPIHICFTINYSFTLVWQLNRMRFACRQRPIVFRNGVARCSSLAGERYQPKSSFLFSLDGEFPANLRCVLAVGNSFSQATITACDLKRGCNRGGGYNARCNTVPAHS